MTFGEGQSGENPDAAPAAAAASAADGAPPPANTALVDEIKRLNTTILTMRSMVNELITSHNELREEVASLKRPAASITQSQSLARNGNSVLQALQQRELERSTEASHNSTAKIEQPQPPPPPQKAPPHKKPRRMADRFQHLLSQPSPIHRPPSTDAEIDAILSTRTKSDQWPVHRKPCHAFTHDPDLVKLRFHRSDKYRHVPVHIPGDGVRKENRVRCKLCMSADKKSCLRNTTFMCAVCRVPLCVKCLFNEEKDIRKTHFARWHSAVDLVEENRRCCGEVWESREEGRRKKAEEGLEKREEESSEKREEESLEKTEEEAAIGSKEDVAAVE
ncbi:hypothetical protein ACHAW6_004164 [Cyclotella cf. meneghiniana]